MPSVMICDERRGVRESLGRFLSGIANLSPVNTVATSDELLERYPYEHPDIVFVGTQRALDTGIETIRRLIAAHAQAAVLVFGSVDDEKHVAEAMTCGARGFLCWDATAIEVYAALAHALADPAAAGVDGARDGTPAVTPLSEGLTSRELEVLVGMSCGKTNQEIGQDLFLSEDTVKTHARRLFQKLGVHDRAAAVANGFRLGLVR
ncbi:MAG: response regulator transcription factor [Mycobacteriales bacterium]